MIRKAKSREDYLIIQRLAEVIYPEVYNQHVHPDHVMYFVNTFQRADAIESQIDSNSEYYIHFEGEVPLAYLGIDILPDKIFLSKLYVLNEHRGKNIGEGLMEFLYARCRALGISAIELFVNKNQLRSIRFYENQGFKKGELLTHSFENGHSVEDYEMTKVF